MKKLLISLVPMLCFANGIIAYGFYWADSSFEKEVRLTEEGHLIVSWSEPCLSTYSTYPAPECDPTNVEEEYRAIDGKIVLYRTRRGTTRTVSENSWGEWEFPKPSEEGVDTPTMTFILDGKGVDMSSATFNPVVEFE